MSELERVDVVRDKPGFAVFQSRVPGGLAQRLLAWEGQPLVSWTAGSLDHSAGAESDPGCSFVGLGATKILRASGEERFASIKKQLEEFAANHPELQAYSQHVRFFGGASFAPREVHSGEWTEFGDALFLLPRVLYVDGPDGARLLGVSPPGEAHETRALMAEAERLLATPRLSADARLEVLEQHSSMGVAAWHDLLGRIHECISSGALEKVVAARRLTLELSAPPELGDLMARLGETEPSAVRFALRLSGHTFLGATPERLVQQVGLGVRTEALAGSISAQTPAGAERLLNSQKDLAEHRVVVDALASALGPLCSSLSVPAQPEIRALRRILHLRTPLSGVLSRSGHVLDLVERLHPTPAVGGYPRSQALAFIAEHELGERGWYASPFGWVNLEGDGEFAVALRSSLLHGSRAQVYAGAGIVRDSVAEDEFAETELKMSSMLGAFGLSS